MVSVCAHCHVRGTHLLFLALEGIRSFCALWVLFPAESVKVQSESARDRSLVLLVGLSIRLSLRAGRCVRQERHCGPEVLVEFCSWTTQHERTGTSATAVFTLLELLARQLLATLGSLELELLLGARDRRLRAGFVV